MKLQRRGPHPIAACMRQLSPGFPAASALHVLQELSQLRAVRAD
jgi:hypothetical protein